VAHVQYTLHPHLQRKGSTLNQAMWVQGSGNPHMCESLSDVRALPGRCQHCAI